jgi:alpha-ribazole phosphatase
MRVLLMRHGMTAANQMRLYNGRTDDPLCVQGAERALKTGTDPTVARVYASPLKRAVETARLKFPNAEITVVDDLREMDFGDFEGRGFDELKNDPEYQRWYESGGTLPCPNGECVADFVERVCRAFDAVVREHIGREDRLVVVAHGGSLMSILSRYGRPERPYYDWFVENCCGYRARLDLPSWARSPVLTGCELFETLTDEEG